MHDESVKIRTSANLIILFNVVTLIILTATVFVYISLEREKGDKVKDLLVQQNALTMLKAAEAKSRERIIGLIFSEELELGTRNLISRKAFEEPLNEFDFLAVKRGVATEQTLKKVMLPLLSEMIISRNQIVSLIETGEKLQATELFKSQYLPQTRHIKALVNDQLEQKLAQVNNEHENERTLLNKFVLVFLIELLVIFSFKYVSYGKVVKTLARNVKALNKMATYDELTGLYNRRMFSSHLEHSIALAKRNKKNFAILLFDLDGFKNVNDSLGHKSGDILLQEIASRVKSVIREVDIFARLGGDEFAILTENVASVDALSLLAKRILEAVEKEVTIAGQSFTISASIGVSYCQEYELSAEQLVKNTDAAMYDAKGAGKGCFKFYSEELNKLYQEKIQMAADIKQALENDEFSIYYQPKVDPKTDLIHGAEALIRWHHPEKGFIPPNHFIPIAEECGLIYDIDRWVRLNVCKQLFAWQETAFYPLKVSVNVSATEFCDTEIHQELIDLFKVYKIKQQSLELEITESTLIDSQTETATNWDILQKIGVNLSIDDFGTGYCSLSYLKELPIDVVKIDKSFIDNCHQTNDDSVLAQTIIAMGHAMDMSVVAEGVELIEQKNFLEEKGCDLIQGYFYSKPLPLNDFETFVREHIPKTS
jgi:diguanylate cyclase (GGDEF)-like protein